MSVNAPHEGRLSFLHLVDGAPYWPLIWNDKLGVISRYLVLIGLALCSGACVLAVMQFGIGATMDWRLVPSVAAVLIFWSAFDTPRATPMGEPGGIELQLQAVVDELWSRSGSALEPPMVWVSQRAVPNASISAGQGRFIEVTRGLVTSLQPDEIRGVLAHELAHRLNLDLHIKRLTYFSKRVVWGTWTGLIVLYPALLAIPWLNVPSATTWSFAPTARLMKSSGKEPAYGAH